MTTWREFFQCLTVPKQEETVRAQLGHLLPREMFDVVFGPDFNTFWYVAAHTTRGTKTMQKTSNFVKLKRAPFELWASKLHPDVWVKIEKELAAINLKSSNV